MEREDMENSKDTSLLTRRRKIILINVRRVVGARGGVEKVFCDMANYFASIGYTVTALCLDAKQGLPGFSLSENVCFVNAWKRKSPLSSGFFGFLRTFSFKKNIRRLKRQKLELQWQIECIKAALVKIGEADLYICFQPRAANILSFILDQNKSIITMIHGGSDFIAKICQRSLTIDALHRSNVVTVLLPSYVKEIKKHSEVPVWAIPNAVCQFNQPASLNQKKIVCIARLSPEKRIELLVRAFNLIKDDISEWDVEFWGEINVKPKYSNGILQLVNKLELKDRFRFCNTTSDIERVLQRASIFVFPSATEGFGLALCEAMSKGVAVVGCKDCSAVNELIINERNGLLTEPTPEAMAEAIKRLALDRNLRLRLGTQARYDMKKYSAENVWKIWDELVNYVTARN